MLYSQIIPFCKPPVVLTFNQYYLRKPCLKQHWAALCRGVVHQYYFIVNILGMPDDTLNTVAGQLESIVIDDDDGNLHRLSNYGS